MKNNRLILSIFLLNLIPITHAKNTRLVSHVILNDTNDSISYDLKNMSGNPCNLSGKILPGQFKDLNCHDTKYTSFSTYSLNFTAFYTDWFGAIKNRCSSIRGYDVKNNKLFDDKKIIWTIHNACAINVTDA